MIFDYSPLNATRQFVENKELKEKEIRVWDANCT